MLSPPFLPSFRRGTPVRRRTPELGTVQGKTPLPTQLSERTPCALALLLVSDFAVTLGGPSGFLPPRCFARLPRVLQ